jgi:hypothetical protein
MESVLMVHVNVLKGGLVKIVLQQVARINVLAMVFA